MEQDGIPQVYTVNDVEVTPPEKLASQLNALVHRLHDAEMAQRKQRARSWFFTWLFIAGCAGLFIGYSAGLVLSALYNNPVRDVAAQLRVIAESIKK